MARKLKNGVVFIYEVKKYNSSYLTEIKKIDCIDGENILNKEVEKIFVCIAYLLCRKVIFM